MQRALVLSLVVAGCVAACVPTPVYRVQRTARVPHPAAPLRTGEPLAGKLELSTGASSIGDSRAPRLIDREASLEVPDQQYRSELRIRLRRAELALIHELASGETMQALDATQAAVETGNPTGMGAAVRYSIDAQGVPGLSFGIGFEVMSWAIPYVEVRTCVENCDYATGMQVNRGVEHVSSAGLSFTPTYRRGPIAMFAGAYTRRHPTIERKGTELYTMNDERDVDGGSYNWLVFSGLEYRLPVVSVLALVQQNLTREPVWYGTSFGLGIAARLPD